MDNYYTVHGFKAPGGVEKKTALGFMGSRFQFWGGP